MGPPPSAPDRVIACKEFPIYGDNITRNCLTHLFNLGILEHINRFPTLKFATLFYSLVDSDLRTFDDALYDGLHLSSKYITAAMDMLVIARASGVKAVLNESGLKAIQAPGFATVTSRMEDSGFIKARKLDSKGDYIYFSRLNAPREISAFGDIEIRPGSDERPEPDQTLECNDADYLSRVFTGASASEFSAFSDFIRDRDLRGLRDHFDSFNIMQGNQRSVLISKLSGMLSIYQQECRSEVPVEAKKCAADLMNVVGIESLEVCGESVKLCL